MNIIVCVKQVPNPENANFNEKSNTVMREGVKAIINPLDLNAIEEALRLRDKTGGRVTALSMGIPEASQLLKEAVGMGVDEAVLLSDPLFAGADTLATSYTLSKGVQKKGNYHLIICGKQSIDGDTAQVGPSLAEKLGIPHITCVDKIEETGEGFIKCRRIADEGYEIVQMKLPGLITVVKGINEPRLPTLKGIMRSKKAEIPIWNCEDIGADAGQCGFSGSPTKVFKSFVPDRRVDSRIIAGSPEEQAAILLEELKKAL
ncbi:electron transfer flavoprotein beta subunit [Anaerobacterium chartisolvens]|uniref:Electron transfer flavoprotein small subunit n=1 Tax=Anaerobacterium chartisolvens TaxID=1297424 RepID=A0A369B9G1_9FIRM|nr:electron transfer flavoprotein subunit beta/FixA family protein [Anaerobacterium chartisolvens]RCX16314.1 electron transfer flavoprotein beta subunit [Anaerobacterium chartisolvens]